MFGNEKPTEEELKSLGVRSCSCWGRCSCDSDEAAETPAED